MPILQCLWMEKLRWLIGDIFEKLREIDIELAIKFDNINALKIEENILNVKSCNNLFHDSEKEELRKIFIKNLSIRDTNFISENYKILYPYPVQNSKFNNFVTIISIEENNFNLKFFQKDNKKYFESFSLNYTSMDDFMFNLTDFTLGKIELFENLYRYNQIILPFKFFKSNVKYINDKWKTFLLKEKITKYVDKIYFYV